MAIDTSGFGAYDIRGIYPKTINQELAYRVGRVFPELFDAKKVAVGHDVRLSSPTINDALIRGLTEAGCEVYDIGQCGTEMIYFTVGSMELDGGIMVTASHNPQEYNGLKCVKKGSQPISPDTGLFDLRDKVADENFDWSYRKSTGNIHKIDIMSNYINCILSYVDVKNLKPLKVVINTGNGAAGPVINELEKYLPFEIVKIFNDPDGHFPNGVPNPLRQDNREVTAKAVIENNADCGVAFDGDFDRCFLFDEKGGFIEGYYLVGFLAQNFLMKHKGESVVYDPRAIWNTIDIVESMGGRALMCRSGHSYVKEMMRKENSIYGGEMSSHHYFRDFYYCDSGMIPWLMVLELLSQSEKTLSELMRERQLKYPVSGELNTKVAGREAVKAITKEIEKIYGKAGKIVRVDGFGVDFDNWRFNLRSSETEPYIRLNVETRGDENLLKEKTNELLETIRRQNEILARS